MALWMQTCTQSTAGCMHCMCSTCRPAQQCSPGVFCCCTNIPEVGSYIVTPCYSTVGIPQACCPPCCRSAIVDDLLQKHLLIIEVCRTPHTCCCCCSTNIHYLLQNMSIKQLILVGCVTDQCVAHAVKDACDLGYLVTLLTGEHACICMYGRDACMCMYSNCT